MVSFRSSTAPSVTLGHMDRHGGRRERLGLPNRSTALSLASAVLLVVLVATRWSDLRSSAGVLADLALVPFLIAVGLSGLGLLNRAGQLRAAHRLAGLEADLRSMGRVSAAGYALNKVVKTGGLGGVALYVRHGRRRGFVAGSVLAACLVNSLAGQAAMVAVVVIALGSMIVTTPMAGSLIVAAALVAALALIGLPAVAATCVRSRGLVERCYDLPFTLAGRFAARFGMRSPTVPDRAHLDRFYDAITTLRVDPGSSLPVLAHALAAKVIGASVLVACLAAVGADIGPGAALLVYALALVAAASTILPGGVGAVEATMTVLLTSYGVPTSVALAGTLAFRLLDLWLPIVVGLIAAPGLDGSTERSKARAESARRPAPLAVPSLGSTVEGRDAPAPVWQGAATCAHPSTTAPASTSGSSWPPSARPWGPRSPVAIWPISTTTRSPRSSGPCTTTACWCSGTSPCPTLTTTP